MSHSWTAAERKVKRASVARVTSPSRCPLRNDWRQMTPDQRDDALFMICPLCKSYGSHVGAR